MRFCHLFVLILLSLLITKGSFAQETQSKNQNKPNFPVLDLNQDPIDSKSKSSNENEELIIVNATRNSSSLFSEAEKIDVIQRDKMDKYMMNDFSSLTRYLPGINVENQTNATDVFGNSSGFKIRGVSGNRVLMQIDGNRIAENILDGNRDYVDLAFMKKVEIVSGPNSVLWGSDALGGVVAFQTLDPSDLLNEQKFAGKANINYQSVNEEIGGNILLSSEFSDKTQGLIGISTKKFHEREYKKAQENGGIWGCPRPNEALSCNQLNPMDANVYSLLSKLVLTPNDAHKIKLTAEYFENKSDVNVLHDYGTQINGSFNADNLKNQKQTRSRISFEDLWLTPLDWLNNVKFQLTYSPQKRTVLGNRIQVNTNKETIKTFSKTEYEEKFLQSDIQFSSSLVQNTLSHEFLYGFQGDFTKNLYDNYSQTHNLTTNLASEKFGTGFNFSDAKTIRSDFYLQDKMSFFNDRFTLAPAVRFAYYRISPNPDEHYKPINGFEPKTVSSSRFIPHIGATYEFDNNYLVYANFAEGFKMPTAQQLFTSVDLVTSSIVPNPNLQAEKVKNYEIGFRKQSHHFDYSISAFYADYSNYIRSLTLISDGIYSYSNVDSVKLSGIEASANWDISKNWQINSALTYQHGTQQKDKKATKTAYDDAIPLSGTIGLTWHDAQNKFQWDLISVFSKGVTRTSSSDIYKPGGYAVFDAYFNWNPTQKTTLRFGIKNIFDRRYISGPLSSDYTINPSDYMKISSPLELKTAPGRNFTADISIKF